MHVRIRNNCICLLLLLGILNSCLCAERQAGDTVLLPGASDALHATIVSHTLSVMESVCTDELLGRSSAIQSIRQGQAGTAALRNRVALLPLIIAFSCISEAIFVSIWLLASLMPALSTIIIHYIQQIDGKKPRLSSRIA